MVIYLQIIGRCIQSRNAFYNLNQMLILPQQYVQNQIDVF